MPRPHSPPPPLQISSSSDRLLSCSSPASPYPPSPASPHTPYDMATGLPTPSELDDKEMDDTVAFLEARRATDPAAAQATRRSSWANALSRKLSQRNVSRRAVFFAMLAAVGIVSLASTADSNSEVGADNARPGLMGGLARARGKLSSAIGMGSSMWRAEYDGPEQYDEFDILQILNYDTPQETLAMQLKDGVRYATAMAYGGHANQMISIQKLLYFAKLTNRVGIIPTLLPAHIDGHPENLSTFYDLPRFYHESRIPAVEMSRIKPVDWTSSRPQNEHLSCWSVQEATVGFANLEAWSFDLHGIWINHWPLPPMARGLGGFDLAFDALRVFDFDQWAKSDWIGRVQRESLPQKKPADGEEFSGDPATNLKDGFDPAGTQPPNDQIMCFDNTLFLGPIMFPPLPVSKAPLEPAVPGEGLSWISVGQHLHFNPAVEAHADEYLMRLFDVAAPAQIPPFISIHLRRGDFKEFAGFTALEQYTAALERARATLQFRLDNPDGWTGPGKKHFRAFEGLRADEYAVVATTDERGESEFVKEVRALGWKVLDHDAFETKDKLGGWWPTMLDGAILARGRSFVGTDRSTFSHLAGLRVKYWHGGVVEVAR
ncbi:hypothetical protein JCM5296_001501 [Sporobolomyces johnsonii]